MAGSPVRRARREAEARERAAAAGRAKRVDPRLRWRALKRASETSDRQAASEFGIKQATLRTWRRRAKDEPPPPEPVAVVQEDRPEVLRREADRARQAAARAYDSADRLLGKGLAGESRNATATAASFDERAAKLEDLARVEEAHRIAITQAEGELLARLVRTVFTSVELPLGVVLE